MNKLWRFLTGTLVVGVLLVACSDMALDNPRAESFPDDFVLATFSQINPDIANYQRRMWIQNVNQAFLDSMKKGSPDVKPLYRELYRLDTVALWNSPAVVESLMVNYANYQKPALFAVSELDREQKKMILNYNYINIEQAPELNLELLRAVVIDSVAILTQYDLYGKAEGRPYRYCTAAESMGVVKDVSQASQTDKLLYDYRPHYYCQDSLTKVVYLIPSEL